MATALTWRALACFVWCGQRSARHRARSPDERALVRRWIIPPPWGGVGAHSRPPLRFSHAMTSSKMNLRLRPIKTHGIPCACKWSIFRRLQSSLAARLLRRSSVAGSTVVSTGVMQVLCRVVRVLSGRRGLVMGMRVFSQKNAHPKRGLPDCGSPPKFWEAT